MNLIDQQGLEALQRAIGMNPAGSAGFSPVFGPLPAMSQLPPGVTLSPGGSFFGPQLLNPYRMPMGFGMIGSTFGYGVEQFMASRGFEYFPRGVNVVDVVRGREFERGLERSVAVGAQFDEQRLANAIATGMRTALGQTGPMAQAQAGALASTLAPFFQVTGAYNLLPGGSASDFARSMYLASRNMVDFTRDRYEEGAIVRGDFRLGLPSEASRGLINRMMDLLAPRGFDVQRTRGLRFDEMGQLAGELSRFGAIRTTLTDSDISGVAAELGVSGQLTAADRSFMTQAARPASIVRQLQQYAEVVGTVREILGAPDAPIPVIIRELQSLTGGSMQELNPGNIQNLLHRVRETARAANISMTTMMEIVKSGAVMGQQMGLSPLLGGQIAAQAASATVVSQTGFQGPFTGRMSPDYEMNVRQQWLTRGVSSPAVQFSVQAMRMLEDVDRSRLSSDQMRIAETIEREARQLGWSPQRIVEMQQMFGQIGVGPNRVWQRVSSTSGVQQYLVDNSWVMDRIQAGQIAETATALGQAASPYFRYIGAAGGNDVLVGQISRAAAASKMTEEQFLDLVGRSIIMAGGPDVADRSRWLTGQGVQLADVNMRDLFRGLEAMPQFEAQIRARGVSKLSSLWQLAGADRLRRSQELGDNVDIAIRGQQFLQQMNIGMRGGTLERMAGAIAGGARTFEEMVATGFGFMPSPDLVAEMNRTAFEQIGILHDRQSDVQREIDSLAGVNTSEANARRLDLQSELKSISSEIQVLGQAAASSASRIPGLAGTRPMREILSQLPAGLGELGRAAGDVSKSARSRIESVRSFVGQFEKLSPGQIETLAASMRSSEDAEFVRSYATSLRVVTDTAREQLSKYDSLPIGHPGRARAGRAILETGATDTMAGFDRFRAIIQRAERVEARAGSARTIGDRAGMFNAMVDAIRGGSGDTPDQFRSRLIRMSEAGALGEGVWYERDPETGIPVPKEEFIREMVMLDKTIVGDKSAQMKRADEIRNTIEGMLYVGGLVRGEGSPEGLDAEQLKKLQDRMRRVNLFGGQSINDPLGDGRIVVTNPDPTRIEVRNLLTNEQLSDMERAVVIARDVDLESSEILRQRPDLARRRDVYRRIDDVRELLGAPMPKSEEGRRLRADLIRQRLEGGEGTIFKDGRLTQEAVETLYATMSMDQAAATASMLNEYATGHRSKWDWLTSDADYYRSFKANEAEKASKANAIPTGDASASATLTLRDPETGESLKSLVIDIDVRHGGNGRAREAAERMDPLPANY